MLLAASQGFVPVTHAQPGLRPIFPTPPLDSLLADIHSRVAALPQEKTLKTWRGFTAADIPASLDAIEQAHRDGILGSHLRGSLIAWGRGLEGVHVELDVAIRALGCWLLDGPTLGRPCYQDLDDCEAFIREFLGGIGMAGTAVDHVVARADFDLAESVWVVTIPPAYEMVQWHAPGVRETSYTDVGFGAGDAALPQHAIGVDGTRVDRVATVYRPTRPVEALMIRTRRDVMDDWTIPGTPFLVQGGGNAYIMGPEGIVDVRRDD